MEQIEKKEQLTVLAVPCSRVFVVAPEKWEEFKNQSNSKEDNEQILQMAEMFIRNNLVSKEEPKKRTRTKN